MRFDIILCHLGALYYRLLVLVSLHLDEQLLNQAAARSGVLDKTELIHAGLRALIAGSDNASEAQPPPGATATTTPSPTSAIAAGTTSVNTTGPSAAPSAPASTEANTGSVPEFFGPFLVSKRAITADQLAQAEAHVSQRNARLGELAVERGLLSNDDAVAINRKQREIDSPFGEIAVADGALTRFQVDQLLELQKQRRVRIGDAVVAIGAMAEDEIEGYFREYQLRAQEQSAKPDGATATVSAPPFVDAFLSSLPKVARRSAQLQLKVGGGHPVTERSKLEYSVLMEIQGSPGFEITMSANEELAQVLMIGVLGEGFADMDDPSFFDDSLGEFLTLIAAQTIKVLNEDGADLRLQSPCFEFEYPNEGIAYPLMCPQGQGTIVFRER